MADLKGHMRLRRACLFLALGLAVWVGVAEFTGGFTIRIGATRLLSARNPRNPAILAFLFAAAWWALARHGGVAPTLRDDTLPAARALVLVARRAAGAIATSAKRIGTAVVHASGWLAPRLPAWIGLAAAADAVAVAALEGVFVVGGADSYGYVSQAHLLAEGRLRVDEPLIVELHPLAPPEAAVPLGYHVTPDGAVAPSYSPGFPLLMTLFQWVAGREAVFAVLPVMAGVMVWATFLLGRLVAGPAVGAAAAVLLAVSPTFVFQSISPPMSDVPGAAWWTLALVWALMGSGSVAAAAGSGIAAAWAVLTRPNLVPLALLPLLVIAWPIISTRTLPRRTVIRSAVYCTAVAAACIVVAVINWTVNGSPLLSGYGSLSMYYAWSNWTHNMDRYSTWLIETQTPLIATALVAPIVLWRNSVPGDRVAGRPAIVALSAFVVVVGVSYLYYLRFGSWIYLRFLLPAYPILLAFMCAVLLSVTRRLPRAVGPLTFAVVIGLLAWDGISETRSRGVFFADSERKYALVGQYVARRLPDNGIVLASQHGGNVRYYSGRKIVRWDLLDPVKLTAVIDRLRERGYEPYLLVEDWEVEPLRHRFPGHPLLAVLDTPPVARLTLGDIRLYSLAPSHRPSLVTDIIPDP